MVLEIYLNLKHHFIEDQYLAMFSAQRKKALNPLRVITVEDITTSSSIYIIDVSDLDMSYFSLKYLCKNVLLTSMTFC